MHKLNLINRAMKIFLLIPDMMLSSSNMPPKRIPKTGGQIKIGLGVPLLIRQKRDISRGKANVTDTAFDPSEKQSFEDNLKMEIISLDLVSSSKKGHNITMLTQQTKLMLGQLQQTFYNPN
jgi:hypothetical protein